jgi:hypothetical protein
MKPHLKLTTRIQILICLLVLVSCDMKNKDRFFSEEEFETELRQDVNADVLRRIQEDTSITADQIRFSFYYITDDRVKIDSLIDYFEANLKEYQIMELNKNNKIWELNARSSPVTVNLDSINEWEKNLWDIGYKFDCRLDGWETLYNPE